MKKSQRTRACEILNQVQADGKKTGANKLTMKEIDAEIAKARREMRSKRKLT